MEVADSIEDGIWAHSLRGFYLRQIQQTTKKSEQIQ
jgi:hypothetical protein